MKSNSIIFVCTGNTYRSVLAKKAFENFIATKTTETWTVDSAGIVARPDTMRQDTIDFLQEKGIEVHHKQTKLECQMLSKYSFVVAMAENHLEFMKKQCGFLEAKLFNELAVCEKSSLWDVEDNVPNAAINDVAVRNEVRRTAEYVFSHMSLVFENIKKSD